MPGRIVEYLDSIVARDPAPRSRWEVLLYPGVWALTWHRLAHWLFNARLFFLARMINHMARFLTAIDIHPGAKIGRHLFIDHGFTVIGETAIIGDNVTIYQCVTLGGTKPFNGVGGKRHPTLEDNVIVGSGAQILGPIVVGKRARIGASAVVTEDVPEGALDSGGGRNLAAGFHAVWHAVLGQVRPRDTETGTAAMRAGNAAKAPRRVA